MSTVSKSIRRLRMRNNMTQDRLAEKMNVTRQAVSNWETEKTQPDIETLGKLADVFGTDINEVIYGTPKGSYPRYLKKYLRVMLISLTVFLCMILIHERLIPYLIELVNDIHFKYRESRSFIILSFAGPLLAEGIGSMAFGVLVPSVVSLFFDTQVRKRKALLISAASLSVPLVLTLAETVLWCMDLRHSGKMIYYSLVHSWFRFMFLWVCSFCAGTLFFLWFNRRSTEGDAVIPEK